MLTVPVRKSLYLGLTCMVAAMVSATAACLGLFSCQSNSTPRMLIKIGMEATAVNALIYVAEARNFFSGNGIDLEINDSFLRVRPPPGKCSRENWTWPQRPNSVWSGMPLAEKMSVP